MNGTRAFIRGENPHFLYNIATYCLEGSSQFMHGTTTLTSEVLDTITIIYKCNEACPQARLSREYYNRDIKPET